MRQPIFAFEWINTVKIAGRAADLRSSDLAAIGRDFTPASPCRLHLRPNTARMYWLFTSMKRCPQCRREYYDETLNFCLEDGMRLEAVGTTGPLDATVMFPTISDSFNLVESLNLGGTSMYSVAPVNTIAVLPFMNLSRDADDDYFSDGLAEELLNVLSKIDGLRVAARTSAFSFKGRQTTVADIGRILNVGSVLDGSVRRAGERMRISVQLVNAVDGYQLWSETYDRTMDDLFAIQDDIARSVVEEIRKRLVGDKEAPGSSLGTEIANASKGRSADPEAQRLFMLGRHLLDRTTRGDTIRAVEYLQQALDIDPAFALGWAELGRARSIQGGRGWMPVDEAFQLSREATQKALAIEPDLAEGHAQMGRILAAHEWDLNAAEASYRRALELAPGSSAVMDGASVLFYKLGRLDEAIDLGRRVLAQDPLSAAYWHNLGLTCHAAGQLDESEKAFRRALEVAPNRFVSHALLALILLEQGKRDEAVKTAASEPDEFWRLWAEAIIATAIGDNNVADGLTARLISDHSSGNEYQIAEVYAMRDESDHAFDWLERALKNNDPGVTHAKVNPRFASLRTDARWMAFLQRAGFK
jgi:TolB-like protein/Tfp pilus assembly protein PilF